MRRDDTSNKILCATMVEVANDVPTAMSTSALESKLRDLKEKSNKHSQVLTAKLASSQSGQNLLHIGTSLSSLPPDLHSLLTQLHPVVSAAEGTEKQYLQHLQRLVQCGNEIRLEERRVASARDCADLYQDLLAAESIVRRDASQRRAQAGLMSGGGSNDVNPSSERDSSLGTWKYVSRSSNVLYYCAIMSIQMYRNADCCWMRISVIVPLLNCF